tara:strand:- start:127 stop:738 length:612 start_codon:yes stop_codon:yes gene_type:complete
MAQPITCVAVGDAGVGKTCLLTMYTTDSFPGEKNPATMPTHTGTVCLPGDATLTKLTTAEGLQIGPKTDVCLVCFSVISRSSFDNVGEKWLKEIENFTPGTPFILVGTKTDLRDDDDTKGPSPVTKQEGEEMCRKLGGAKYLECSALLASCAPSKSGIITEAQIAAKKFLPEVFNEAIRCARKKREEQKKEEDAAKSNPCTIL